MFFRNLARSIAQRIPLANDYMERFAAISEENGKLRAKVARIQDENESLLSKLAIVQQNLAASRDRAKVYIGPYVPPPMVVELSSLEQEIVDRFHELYYARGQKDLNTNHISWLGYSLLKCPLDLWIYQELIYRQLPDVIVETGTASGGSALYLALLCELVGHGEVITIDVDPRTGQDRPVHPRLTYLIGSSIDPKTIDALKARLTGRSRALVILDSDHRRDHVLEELRIYRQFVPLGGYMVVEDTNINGHPAYPEFGPGPMEALDAFLQETDAFQSDSSCERFLLTMNPRGFLRRIK